MTDDIPSVGKIVHISPENTNGIPSQSNSETDISMLSNFPNPFHRNTTIRFFLPEAGNIKVNINSVLGEKMRSYSLGEYHNGWNTFTIDEPNLLPGVYYLQLTMKNIYMTTKLCVY